MMNYKSIGLALASLVSVAVAGQEATSEKRSFSRAEAEMYALENSYDMQRYSLELDRAKAVIFENVATGLPQVTASASFTDNIQIQQQVIEFNGQPTLLAFGVRYGAMGTLQVDQLIFDGSYIVALLATEVVKETAQNSYEKSAIDVREQVAQAYHLVLTTERSLQIIRDNLTFIRQSLFETRELFNTGMVEKQDVDQLDLLVTNLESNEDYLERQAEVARTILKLRMGIPVTESVTLTDNIETLVISAEDATELLSTTFDPTTHIDYRTLETGIHGQELTLRNEQVQWLPKLNGYYSYNHGVQSSSFDGLTNFDSPNNFNFPYQSWGLSLRWSLFQGGRRVARVQEAKVALEQLEVQEAQLSDMLKLQYQTAKAEYAFAVNNFVAQRKNMEIAKDIRDRTAIKFREGISSSLEFTQAENQYQDALRSMINAAQTALDKRVALEKVLGNFNLN
ncbi:MAG: TolC family protein [Bacteroidetes bacterium]|uniref:TolC family protein n=1 Tax=Phaeocystidibacter marisrubri TaxID=1577780 RepID=A0A6L3ZF62_9FLAO|nr:TolC family protein [Phaeocystidibacter marisrubri]KAB2816350.1 TolC family protein [Phaeocystidibacter marisrubri]TNE28163.1 MAG: TolC family protein [Bacteroidota bacterium]GGH68585.1 transporter [Phaeocystidibacter marisrubri]